MWKSDVQCPMSKRGTEDQVEADPERHKKLAKHGSQINSLTKLMLQRYIYSPMRVVPVAQRAGLRGGTSMDLLTGWDFTLKPDRDLAIKYNSPGEAAICDWVPDVYHVLGSSSPELGKEPRARCRDVEKIGGGNRWHEFHNENL